MGLFEGKPDIAKASQVCEWYVLQAYETAWKTFANMNDWGTVNSGPLGAARHLRRHLYFHISTAFYELNFYGVFEGSAHDVAGMIADPMLTKEAQIKIVLDELQRRWKDN